MSPRNVVSIIVLMSGLIGCQNRHSAEREQTDASRSIPVAVSIVSRPLHDRPEQAGDTLFDRLDSSKTGVDFSIQMELDHRLSLLNHTVFVAGGVCLGDVNGDGRPDLFFANGPSENKLFLQTGPFQFEEVTHEAGVAGGDAWGVGAAIVDIENDGDLDIYVCNYESPNQLYINDGTGTHFRELARQYGLAVSDACLMPTFADYDNDGDLDAFVLTYRSYRPGGRPEKPPVEYVDGVPRILPEFQRYYFLRQVGPNRFTADTCGRPDYLFQNNGDGTFSSVGAAAGIKDKGHGLSATWWDFDRDGFIDLYVGNDFTDPDYLYHNNGDGTFTNVIADVMPYTTWSSMGADCADINNDGMLDFMSVDMAATTHYKAKITMGDMGDRRWFLENAWPRQTMRNTLFLNTGTQRFMETAFLSNVANSDWTWAVKFADFDNDSKVDLYFTNGATRMRNDADVPVSARDLIGRNEWDIWKETDELREVNLAFRNAGDLRFEKTENSWGLDHKGMSYAAAYGDIDGDGDVDLVVVNVGEPASVYRNNSHSGHSILVQLVGKTSNRNGLGAVIYLETENGRQIRQLMPTTGYLSGNDPTVHFGLGAQNEVNSLTVQWPSGHVQTFENLPADRRYEITESAGMARPREAMKRETRFTEVASEIGLEFTHRETPYDDYQRQPLLPGKLSQLGGGMAWGDLDGDNDDDLYVAGAAGQAGEILTNQGGGKYSKNTINRALFTAERGFEDMAPLWLDYDLDGDLDLLVTSGGVECDEGSDSLRDRIYTNDGHGKLTRSEEDVLPPAMQSSSVAVAADFDRDGDLDLFIGARSIPGKYPETPQSRLLRNDRGRFTDVTSELAPGLRNVGLVTGALWSDANGDGQTDLLVALEWGPVKLFVNTRHGFADQTSRAGLAAKLGWWNSITGADVDQDGDTDYIAMNVGLNTKYGKPSNKKPTLLYYGDMEGNGRKRLVEAKPDKSGLVPIRGRSCSSNAMPMVGEKFPTYRAFASSILPEIYSQQCLDEALQFKATHFESGVYVNNGKGKFAWRSFPRMAQASPGYGVVASDFNGDGAIELYASQNLFSREPETGLWRGGIGVSLTTKSDQRFHVLPPDRTGFVVHGDAKGLTVCDFDDDGWPDLVVAQNNDKLLAFKNRGLHDTKPLSIRLRGPAGNPHGIGTRIIVSRDDGSNQLIEAYGGSGYLSQSPGVYYVGNGDNRIVSIEAVWSDGRRTTVSSFDRDQTDLSIRHPDSNGDDESQGGGRLASIRE